MTVQTKASTKSTRSNKNQNDEIQTRNLKVMVERLDSSLYSPVETLRQQPDIEKKAKSVKVAKEPPKVPEVESSGRATRSRQAKVNGNENKSVAVNAKPEQKKSAAESVAVKSKPATRGQPKKPKVTTSQAPEEKPKVVTTRTTRAGSKVVKITPQPREHEEEEVPKTKDLVVRVRKISASSYKKGNEEIQEVEEDPAPKRRGRSRKDQKEKPQKTAKEVQTSSADKTEKPVKKAAAEMKDKLPATKHVVVRVRKMRTSEYQNMGKENVETSSPRQQPENALKSKQIQTKAMINEGEKTPLPSKAPASSMQNKNIEGNNAVDEDLPTWGVLKRTKCGPIPPPPQPKTVELPRRPTRRVNLSPQEKLSILQSKPTKEIVKLITDPNKTLESPKEWKQISEVVKKRMKSKKVAPVKFPVDSKKRPTRGNVDKIEAVEDIQGTSSSAIKAPPQAPISPSTSGTSLKIIDKPDDNDDDPYNFNMSQPDNSNKNSKKVVKPKKRPAAKAKPGNKMELLMHKETLDAAGYSLTVQSNPSKYNDEMVQVEKQINVPGPSISKVAISDDRPKPAAPSAVPLSKPCPPVMAHKSHATAHVTTQKSLPNINRPISTPVPLKPSTSAPLTSLKPFHSKVWHSPPVTTGRASNNAEVAVPAVPFISSSPPIQSTFARRMASQRINANDTTPFRVGGNLPSAFYMGLSNNDGTPSFSSDLVEKDQRDESTGEKFKKAEKRKSGGNDENLNKSAPENDENFTGTSNSHNRSAPSYLGDSNAENMEPPGFMKSPMKRRRIDPLNRSPLKALAVPKLPEGDVSSISVFNTTMDQSITVKTFDVVEKVIDESLDLLQICEQAQEESQSRDTFGFDELLEVDRQMPSTSSAHVVDTSGDIREKLKNMKKYLPSKNNKSRDKNIFPSTPVKSSDVFKAPNESGPTSIRKFMSASTPLGNTLKVPKSSFGDVSRIEETNESVVTQGEDDESNIELFGDQSELFNVSFLFKKRNL